MDDDILLIFLKGAIVACCIFFGQLTLLSGFVSTFVEIYYVIMSLQPTQNGSVGLALWFRWAEPLTDTAEDIAAAQRGTDFLLGWYETLSHHKSLMDSFDELRNAIGTHFASLMLSKVFSYIKQFFHD